TTLKMAVFAPIPSASVSTATAVKPGFFSNWRKANFKSFIFSIYDLRFGQRSGVPCRSQAKFSTPKPQAPKKSQASNSKPRCRGSRLEIEIWGLLGIWVLGFGVFIRTAAPPLVRFSQRGGRGARRPARPPRQGAVK